MLFLYDNFDQSVEVFADINQLAKHVLTKLRVSIELGTDPIQLAKKSLGNRGRVLTPGSAFAFIAEQEGKHAQEMACKFRDALERVKRK